MEEIKYKAYTVSNFREIPQMASLSNEEKFAIKTVGKVLPFKTNNYVVNKLINWDDYRNDPIFALTFPQKNMLVPEHYYEIASLLKSGANSNDIRKKANEIRMRLNPQSDGQIEHNVPQVDGIKLPGVQHKYDEIMLFFPSQGQTCHAYCTFCFRWPQFVGIKELKFASRQTELMVKYVRTHSQITDVLFTGGDPLIMRAKQLKSYILPLLKEKIPHLKTIRIGSKSLTFWPYRFLTDDDSEELLDLFKMIIDSGIHLAFMANFNHYRELETEAVQKAIQRILKTGAQIRTQSPLLRHINAKPDIWAKMWRKQVDLGCIPYYMFQARDTGAQHYFGVPLVEAWRIFKNAYRKVSGICRTVRGPSMSTDPGKIKVLGVTNIKGEKVIVLSFIQARNPKWVKRPFFAEYDEEAMWLDDLVPAFGEEMFFFEDGFNQIIEKRSHIPADTFVFE
ncbi:KamA family radical SAM protein [Calditrichota bacterium]